MTVEHKKNKMKKTFLVFLLLASISLFPQSIQFKKPKKMKIFNKELVFPEMTSEYEKLTTAQLQKTLQKQDLLDKEMPLKKSDGITPLDDIAVYKEYDAKNDYSVNYGFNKKDNIFWESIHRKIEPNGKEDIKGSLYFDEGKSYYPNGNLKEKWLFFQGNSDLTRTTLKQFQYDEKGNLTKEIDISKIYKLSLIDVLKILEKNNLNIDFNNAGGYGYADISPIFIWHKRTNHGKVWIINAMPDNFQAVIYDESGDILIKKDVPSQKVFLCMTKKMFDDYYKNKTIEEVEKEAGIKLFVYEYDDGDL